MAAQFVTPFRKGRATKNDRTDADAIATAARQGNMSFVPVKSVQQLARLSWHRVREGDKAESLANGNQVRGLLAEFGVVVAQSDLAPRRVLADLDAQPAPPAEFKELMRDLAAHWAQVRTRIDACDARIESHAREDESGGRLRAIIGIGPITADAAVATVGKWPPGWGWYPLSTRAAGKRGLARLAIANKHARQIWVLLECAPDFGPL